MNRHGSLLGLMGASVAAGMFPTFQQAFATDLAEHEGAGPAQAVDASVSAAGQRQAAETVPTAPPEAHSRAAIAWQPFAI